MTKYIGYYRVSTQKQGVSGLGLEAQEKAVKDFLKNNGGELIGSFVEVESATGRDALKKRPKLKQALEACRKQKCTLLISRLDRLARNVAFISNLMETKIPFTVADLPFNCDPVMLHFYAVMSEWEARQISSRTKLALQAAKARGVVLGATGPANLKGNQAQRAKEADQRAEDLRHVISDMAGRGMTERAMCEKLTRVGVKTAQGCEYSVAQLRRVRARLASMPALAKAA
jgi:DNA invertase Pin-like site-specific DNA recombinase